MTHEDYVSFEQAQKLKELGFDWECFFPYTDGKIVRNHPCPINWNNHGYTGYELISAPTLSQAQKWLREVKDICVMPIKCCKIGNSIDGKYYSEIRAMGGEMIQCSHKIKDTYEEALSEGINEALEILKEQENGNY